MTILPSMKTFLQSRHGIETKFEPLWDKEIIEGGFQGGLLSGRSILYPLLFLHLAPGNLDGVASLRNCLAPGNILQHSLGAHGMLPFPLHRSGTDFAAEDMKGARSQHSLPGLGWVGAPTKPGKGLLAASRSWCLRGMPSCDHIIQAWTDKLDWGPITEASKTHMLGSSGGRASWGMQSVHCFSISQLWHLYWGHAKVFSLPVPFLGQEWKEWRQWQWRKLQRAYQQPLGVVFSEQHWAVFRWGWGRCTGSPSQQAPFSREQWKLRVTWYAVWLLLSPLIVASVLGGA